MRKNAKNNFNLYMQSVEDLHNAEIKVMDLEEQLNVIK